MRIYLTSLLLIFFVFAASPVFPQTYQMSYGGTSSDIAFYLDVTSDGGYVQAGNTYGGTAASDQLYLVKTDASGTLQWYMYYGGSASDYCRWADQTSDGGFVLAGFTQSYGYGGSDMYLLKAGSTGAFQWARVYGGTVAGVLSDAVWYGQQTSDAGFILAGITSNFGASGQDMYFLKTTSVGVVEWSRVFGGSGTQYAHSIRQLSGGAGYIAAGYTYFGAFNEQICLVKLNSNGTVAWGRTYDQLGVNDRGEDVIVSASGGYIVTGYWGTAAFLMRTDANGNVQWFNTYAGTISSDNGKEVRELAGGDIIVTGNTWSYGFGNFDIFLFRTDANGTLLWARAMGSTGFEEGHFVQPTTDGGFIVAGSTTSVSLGATGSGANAYLIKTNADGSSGCNEMLASFTEVPETPATGGFSVTSSGFNSTTFTPGSGTPGTTQNVLCSALPADWLSVKAVLQENNRVLVRWSTASETHDDYFIVEKSFNGTDFTATGTVKAAGNSMSPRHYEFIDREPYSDYSILSTHYSVHTTIYYRLKQVDFDGSYSWSETEKVNVQVNGKFSITGIRTAAGLSEIRLSLPASNDVEYEILDLTGSRVLSGSLGRMEAGHHAVKIGTGTLPAGIYGIILTAGQESVSGRMMIY